MKTNIHILKETIDRVPSGMIVLPFDGKTKTRSFEQLNRRAGGFLSKQAASEGFKGQAERIFSCQRMEKDTVSYLVLAGMGKDMPEPSVWRNTMAKAVREAMRYRVKKVAIFIEAGDLEDQERHVRWTVEAILMAQYRFDKYKTANSDPSNKVIMQLGIGFSSKTTPHLSESAMRNTIRVATLETEAVLLVRDLVNEPANVLTPASLAEKAVAIAKSAQVTCKILDVNALTKQKMNLLLAVGQAATTPPRLVHLTYKPNTKGKCPKVALIGKGITFDSGGLCIKPPNGMIHMKTDMAGAATVLGVFSALAARKPKIEVHGILPLAENAVGSGAVRPGDILTALNGKTVEMINTDAEGRLILADALIYAARLKPDLMVDFATLTGACTIALGLHTAGLFSSSDATASTYLDAASRTGELFWRLPLSDTLKPGLKSKIADLKNAGGREGGAITAALFLKEFTEGLPWMHADIAGPARCEKETPLCPEGGSGFGVLTTLEFLDTLAKA